MRGDQSFHVISVQELTVLRTQTGVHIIDARSKSDYEKGHLPDAINLSWHSFCEPAPENAGDSIKAPGFWGKLEDVKTKPFNRKLTACGLNSTTPIIIYADGAKSKGSDGRLSWMLLYLGAREVLLLDGGIKAWAEAGHEITTHPVVAYEAPFITDYKHQRRFDLDELKARLENHDLPLSIDTRESNEFEGALYDYQPRLGRMPNAVNIPFHKLYKEDGTFIAREDFLNLLPKAVAPEFTYCEVGVRASTFALLYELYSGKILPVYDGSFMEWALEADLPIETGPRQLSKPVN